MPLALKQPIDPDPLSPFPAPSGLAGTGTTHENPQLAERWVAATITSAWVRSHGTSLPIHHTGRTALRCAITSGLVLQALGVTLCAGPQAVPSFTRQTGLASAVCHSNPPELTAFGRKFKLDGYTLTDKKPDTTIDSIGINWITPTAFTIVHAGVIAAFFFFICTA